MAKKSAQLVGETVGNYKILQVLGEGGMGAVYKAEHILIGKKVALKMLHTEYSERAEIVSRFFTEAKAVNKIGHRNIVDISDYGQSEDGRPYFIMELLEGTELAKAIEKSGAMELKRALHIFRQVAGALEASHKVGIIHRDLKPENIFLIPIEGNQDFVKVLDFGIAKLQEDKGGNKTKTGMVMGTPAYMAPEQAEGLSVDHRADIYSLGIIFYEILTGEQPFAADTFSRVLIKVLTEPVPPPRIKNPNIPPAIEAVLLKMVEKDPNQRFQSVSEILAALKDAEANVMPAGLSAAQLPPAGADVSQSAPRPPKNPTTLTGMSGEVAKTSRGPSRVGVIVGGLAVTLLSAGAVIFFMVGPGSHWLESSPTPKPQAPVVSATPASTPAPIKEEPKPASEPVKQTLSKVKIEINSKPDGAKILENGQVIGQTPIKFDLPFSETAHTFEIVKEGFVTQTLSITPNANSNNAITLEKATLAKGDKGKKTNEPKPGEIKTDPKKPDPKEPDPGTIGDIETLKPDFNKKN